MDILGMNGFRTMSRVAVVAAAMTALSGVAWAQYATGPSGAGPHVWTNSSGAPELSPSGGGQGAASCSNPNTAACARVSGSSGNAAATSSDEGAGVGVNELQTMPRNVKIPSRRTDD
jgi:hypothetical protein